jgi:aminoglycoside phosphotransferase (APT) family kinase protein
MNSGEMSLAAHTEEFHDIASALLGMGLLRVGEQFSLGRLSGGVSCDVYKVETKRRPPIVVKRALPKLRVATDWRAPPERALTEVAWLSLVAGLNPCWTPKVLGEDHRRHLFAMEYLAPDSFPLWKAELAAGRIDERFASSVGMALAKIHAATAGNVEIADVFANDAQFHALRLEPYLLFTAGRYPDFANAIRDVTTDIAKSRIALMQGDISPKNILCGPDGPIFLDAETACYGDPAFDLAFCLNHFLLKTVWHPQWLDNYARAFSAMHKAYADGVGWEEPEGLDRRAARLLPMLLLARVDGKSPVEYITSEPDKAYVRAKARAMIELPPESLNAVARRYFAGSR